MAILEFLGCCLLSTLVKGNKCDNYQGKSCNYNSMKTFRISYWDYNSNYVATDVCAYSACEAMRNVSSRCDCKNIGFWEEL